MGFILAAVIAGASAAEAGAALSMRPSTLPRVPNFNCCNYCKRWPDAEQKEAQCKGCGAPLLPVMRKDGGGTGLIGGLDGDISTPL